MTTCANLSALLTDKGVLLAVTEQVARSMNGASSRRLAVALDDIALGPEFLDPSDAEWLQEGLDRAEREDRLRFWSSEVERLSNEAVQIVSCVDLAYPTNLAMIHDRPPLLFVRGEITAADIRAVAVVGTRTASADGIKIASSIASELANGGITIISGLAKGIDTAAHAAAINRNGRTIAVYGTTIDKVYPVANRGLARSIAAAGACVSQFLPTTQTGPWCFPVRNVTTSGLSLGTIVVEAGSTSGAKIQAEAAIAHGKRVFLVEQLVMTQAWAKAMAEHPQVTVASQVAEIVSIVDAEVAPSDGILV